MFKIIKFKVAYYIYCWVVYSTTIHHVVKDHIFIALLSCEKKEKENLVLHICTRILNECTFLQPTTDYFENESNVS